MLQPSEEFHPALRTFLESTLAQGGRARAGAGELLPPVSRPHPPRLPLPFPPSELKQRLCSPHEGTRREVMGMRFHHGPCLLYFTNLQCRGAGAPQDRDQSEGAGRRLFRFQRRIKNISSGGDFYSHFLSRCLQRRKSVLILPG